MFDAWKNSNRGAGQKSKIWFSLKEVCKILRFSDSEIK
jgi:prophage antirepressor-like protein